MTKTVDTEFERWVMGGVTVDCSHITNTLREAFAAGWLLGRDALHAEIDRLSARAVEVMASRLNETTVTQVNTLQSENEHLRGEIFGLENKLKSLMAENME